MINIGAHQSIASGYSEAAKISEKIGANTFQFFIRNPKDSCINELNAKDIAVLNEYVSSGKLSNILAHSSYTLNLAGAREQVHNHSKEIFKSDLDIISKLPCKLYNIHPGSYTTQNISQGLEKIIVGINEVLKPEHDVFVLLETMSGEGSQIGMTFEEIKTIIDNIDLNEKMGVCLDTCHLFSAGYDIVNNLDKVLEDFNNLIGIDRIKAMHLNDSQNPLGSYRDNHANIGKGYIGIDAFERIINHKELRHLPMYLETKNISNEHEEEIKLLRSLEASL